MRKPPAAGRSDHMSEVIQRLLAAMNAHDLEAAAALFHESYKSVQPAHPARAFVGRRQMHANWAAMFAGIPDFHAEVISSADHGNTAWSEWTWAGTRSDGRPFDMRGVTIFEVEDGLITGGRLYMEELERENVGIAETVQSLAGRRPDQPARPAD
ncbi:nuclear transport factor 2 family protein [Arthrobacter sp. H-02-3]|nr:nuclear transport factor 2 family protein [Arthrobacter sp. H-02-3]